ncbi:histidine--tRNA ligase [Candidatus Methanocrinis natronophilus]|uniref:Histidine--tRNA ligase n=1 Tax=Candidatus Methanocrinis natronophilus TaxID=3033396 RepID=A0ABT5X6M8_9EURY|nr:histidine--tRNA ligase [Candidatus Methanocrinis natronophilus]MDF0590308.1 histidine--tRNA ligase [Candidatus Methanocrinis natronophilus]
MTIQRPRGTRDFLPMDSFRRGAVKKGMVELLERWGYQEISTPTFEHLELFTIKSGPSITEEIYAFQDKGGRDLALRPELTAPVMRMYVNELQKAPKPLRLHYFGNCFRYERPQRGRFREFWQLGAELIGSDRPDAEAEVISLAHDLITGAGVNGDLHIGYLGLIRSMMKMIPAAERAEVMRLIDKKEKGLLAEKLQEMEMDDLGLIELLQIEGKTALDRAEELAEELARMGEDLPDEDSCVASSEVSPTSAAGDRAARSDRAAPSDLDLPHFREVVELLSIYGVEATVDFQIVRGLDYYTGTVFEIYATGLGAQNQICGGGTYQLAGLLGGQETNSTGFGIGFDRIMEIVTVDETPAAAVAVVFVPQVRGEAVKVAKILRHRLSAPVVVDVMGRGLGPQLKQASSIGAGYAVIVGPKEVEAGKFTLREMGTGSQEALSIDEIAEKLAG